MFVCLFVCYLVFVIPLHIGPKGHDSGIAAAPKGNAGLYTYTHFLPSDGLLRVSYPGVSFSLCPPEKITPPTSQQQNKTDWFLPLLLLLFHFVRGGPDLHFDLRLALPLYLPQLGDRHLALRRLRGPSSSLPS